MSTFSENIVGLVINVISNDVFQKKEDLITTLRLYFFRKALNRSIEIYLKSYDGSVLLSGKFYTFLEKNHIVEIIFSHIVETKHHMTKVMLINTIVSQFSNIGSKSIHISRSDYTHIYHFIEFFYEKIDNYVYRKLSQTERYILNRSLSSNQEILNIIEAKTTNLRNSIDTLRYELSERKNVSAFQNVIDSICFKEFKHTSLFHYSNKQMSNIYGRNEQLIFLSKFLDHSANFSYCVITGPGGIGKSKLAHSFMPRNME